MESCSGGGSRRGPMILLAAAVSWKLIAVLGGIITYLVLMLIYWKVKKQKQDR